MSGKKLDLLWTRLEDAKVLLDLAHYQVKETRKDHVSLPSADGHYAHRQSLHAEELAVKNYRRALSGFMAALPGASEPPLVSGVLTPREREVLSIFC